MCPVVCTGIWDVLQGLSCSSGKAVKLQFSRLCEIRLMVGLGGFCSSAQSKVLLEQLLMSLLSIFLQK